MSRIIGLLICLALPVWLLFIVIYLCVEPS
ncbi:hypothetical protein SAMN05216551_107183 [Chitinasiproducens palmae]|uniref:Uncharacterized protein n=1 Tax=Chitinasiproducens palmae TaxID=1770053 RepID=A0A1H2PRW6_9BURK|nr:hypothetical protein SAMN05216551_107183 [Chitinasiproducens palmae]